METQKDFLTDLALQHIKQEMHQTEIKATFSHFSDFMQDCIKKMKNGLILTEKGVQYSEETIRSYENAWQYITNYEGNIFERKIELTEINYKLIQNFISFLHTKGLSQNSVSLIVSKVKAILNRAFKEGLSYWNGSGVKTNRELTTKVYATMEDIKQMHACKKLTKGQRKVLVIFTIQCFTGLRIDTLTKFLENPAGYIKNYAGNCFIDITSDKTGEQSIVPIGVVVQDALVYLGDFQMPSEQYINRTIKIIANKAGINKDIPIRITKGGMMNENLSPKYKEISTHTARRTFITLLKSTDISDRDIQGMTGHKTEKQLNEYCRSSTFDKVKSVLGHSFFNTKFL